MKRLLYAVVILLFLASAGFAAVAALYAYYVRDLPTFSSFERRAVFQTARILDRNGRPLEEIVDPAGGRRTVVPLDRIPTTLRDATIAAEDASFYSNPGFDPRAILRALYQNFRGQTIVSGASTITQQLIKNTMLSPETTPERKIKEAFLAIEMTRLYSKDRILEMYLNEIFYGNRAYGVEAAAQTYFGISAQRLSLAQASFLAGLPQAPATYDPYRNMPAAKERQAYVLDQMERHGFATPAEVAAARSEPIVVQPEAPTAKTEAPHFVGQIREWLEQRYPSDLLFRAGLQVTTTLDLDTQHLAEQAIREAMPSLRPREATNAALVAMRPRTGEVLAVVGSADFSDPSIPGQVNVAVRPRQPGSTLKPFVYLAALAKGWSPATMIMDVPTTFGGSYTPLNFDGKFRGPVSVRQALGQSLNVPAVKTLEAVGLSDSLRLLHAAGINGLTDVDRFGLSLVLGGGEVSLLDLTFAYGMLANGGVEAGAPVAASQQQAGFRAFDPVMVLKVADATGKVLYEHQPGGSRRVVDAANAYLITHMLSDDEARAPTFGRQSPMMLSRPAAAKSGTTDDFRDSWVMGYTPSLVSGVWVGNSDNRPMKDVVGAQGAGRIWHAFMESALAGTPPDPFVRPPEVTEREVCVPSGLLPTPDCQKRTRELFSKTNLPTRSDDMYRAVEVCMVNGKLATDLVPPNARERRVFLVFPPPYLQWARQNGVAQPPTERCDDVYRGVKTAEIVAPRPGTPLQGTVQVVGSAMMDDFNHLDLEVGEGTEPSAWSFVTRGRTAGVDNALLGVWQTEGLRPGPYTLRLSVYDGVGNRIEARQTLIVAPLPTPEPSPEPSPGPIRPPGASPEPARTRTAPSAPTSAATPVPPTTTPTPRR